MANLVHEDQLIEMMQLLQRAQNALAKLEQSHAYLALQLD